MGDCGSSFLLFSVNFCAFYTVMVRYGGHRHLFRAESDEDALKQINKNWVDLAKVVSEERSYDVFRGFLANIFCVENLDFVTIVQQYRTFARNISIDHVGNTIEMDSPELKPDTEPETPDLKSVHSMSGQAAQPSTAPAELDLNAKHSRKPSYSGVITRKSTRQLVEELVVEEGVNGKRSIDITRLQLNFVPVLGELETAEDCKTWVEWIHKHYISNDGDRCVNLSAKSRRELEAKCKKLLEGESDAVKRTATATVESATAAGRAGQIDVTVHDDLDMPAFFDDAQLQIWKLMAHDSMVHFRNSILYAQLFWNEEDTENTETK